MRKLSESWFIVLAILIACTAAKAQSSPSDEPAKPPTDQSDVLLDWHGIEKNLYANAKPFVDLSLPDVEAEVPELHDLQPAPNQGELPLLLNKTGEKTRDLLRNMPNLIAHEKVLTQVGGKGKPWEQEFEYLILSHSGKDNILAFDEYRTAAKGKNKQDVKDPLTKGFTSAWMRFYPANQRESRFRLLGREQMDGHQTVVVAFAQIQDAVRFPTQFDFGGNPIAVLDQGIAWIDQSDFRIVRIRTDLLAPRPDVYLQKMTAQVHFVELILPQSDSRLWVPEEVVVSWNFKGQTVQQTHAYSKFRFYAVKSKIVP